MKLDLKKLENEILCFTNLKRLILRHVLVFFIFIHSVLALANTETTENLARTAKTYQLMEQQLDRLVEKAPLIDQQTTQIGHSLAKKYLKTGHYQEAIWALEKIGEYQQAEKMRSEIENQLRTAPLDLIGYTDLGVTGAMIGVIGDKYKVVVKATNHNPNKSTAEGEVIPYELDKMLGLNLVPITVERTLDNEAISVQLFLKDAKHTGYQFRDQGYLAGPHKSRSEMYLLDYLIGNADRHYQNSMLTIGGKMFAIDHERSVVFSSFPATITNYKTFDEFSKTSNFVPDQQVIHNIFNTSSDDFKSILLKYTDLKKVQLLEQKLLLVKLNLRNMITQDRLLRPADSHKRLQQPKEKSPLAKSSIEDQLIRNKPKKMKMNKQIYSNLENELTEATKQAAEYIIDDFKTVIHNYINVKSKEKDHLIFSFINELYDHQKISRTDFFHLYFELINTDVTDDFIKESIETSRLLKEIISEIKKESKDGKINYLRLEYYISVKSSIKQEFNDFYGLEHGHFKTNIRKLLTGQYQTLSCRNLF